MLTAHPPELRAPRHVNRAQTPKRQGDPLDLADATLVALAEQLRTYRVFTLDRADFSVYRAHGRRAFELLPARLD